MNSEVIALVGSPNAGKTTLFNWLTNSKYKTVNYPGATVEYSLAQLAPQFGGGMTIMDTPGTYSLLPKSDDEEVTRKALFEHPKFGVLSKVVAVVDATQMARHLCLAKQLIKSGFRVVVALTMTDLLRKAGQQIDLKKLSDALGCPVIPVDGTLGGGLNELVAAIRSLSEKIHSNENKSVNNITDLQWKKEEQLKLLNECDQIAKEVLINSQLVKKKRTKEGRDK